MPELKAKMIGALNKLSPEPVMYKKIKETIEKAITSNEGQTIWLTSTGKNEKGEQVSEMQFEWTIKVRG